MKRLVVSISLLFFGFLWAGGGTGISDPLVVAIKNANMKEVQKIVSEARDVKARINKRDRFKRIPLMWACYLNYVNEEKRKSIEKKRLPIVKFLLEKGAEIDARDIHGWTALLWASWSGLDDMVKLLIDNKANLNIADTKGWTPLMVAAMKGHYKVVKLLVEAGADKGKKNYEGKTALDIARDFADRYKDAVRRKRLKEIVELLSRG